MAPSAIAMPPKPITAASENRRSTKPIMEKRRRARINHSLYELKNLILDAMKKDNARHSKLEKADILEMAVKHLQTVQAQQRAQTLRADQVQLSRYRSGFSECANEVSRFLSQTEGLDSVLHQRLLSHLSSCVNSLTTLPLSQPVHVQVESPVERTAAYPETVPLLTVVPPHSKFVPTPVITSAPSPTRFLGSTVLSPASSERSSPVSFFSTYEPVSPAPAIGDKVWRPW